MKKFLLILIAFISALATNAQIGYQVSLLNSATGEPRAGETVSCVIELKNSEDATILKETKTATSNDFGVISLKIGNANTFAEMDWSKLPLYISVWIDGRLVGSSQVLTVPVAEYAKKTGVLTYENVGTKKILSAYGFGRNIYDYDWKLSGRKVELEMRHNDYRYSGSGVLRIDGNIVSGSVKFDLEYGTDVYTFIGHYSPEDDTIYMCLTSPY